MGVSISKEGRGRDGVWMGEPPGKFWGNLARQPIATGP